MRDSKMCIKDDGTPVKVITDDTYLVESEEGLTLVRQVVVRIEALREREKALAETYRRGVVELRKRLTPDIYAIVEEILADHITPHEGTTFPSAVHWRIDTRFLAEHGIAFMMEGDGCLEDSCRTKELFHEPPCSLGR